MDGSNLLVPLSQDYLVGAKARSGAGDRFSIWARNHVNNYGQPILSDSYAREQDRSLLSLVDSARGSGEGDLPTLSRGRSPRWYSEWRRVRTMMTSQFREAIVTECRVRIRRSQWGDPQERRTRCPWHCPHGRLWRHPYRVHAKSGHRICTRIISLTSVGSWVIPHVVVPAQRLLPSYTAL